MERQIRLKVEIDSTGAEISVDKLDKTMADFAKNAKKYFEKVDAEIHIMGGIALQTAGKMFKGILGKASSGMRKVAAVISTGIGGAFTVMWAKAVKTTQKAWRNIKLMVERGKVAIKRALAWPFEQMKKIADKTFKGVINAFKNMSRRMYSAAAGALAGAIGGDALKKTQVELDKFEAMMSLVTKSAGEADGVWNTLMQTGEAFGTVISENIADFSKLSAIMVRSKVPIEDVTTMFSQLSQVSAVYHLSATDTNLAILALTQMVSKGKVSMEEFRRQLAERIPGAVQVAARAFGTNARDLGKMIEEGFVDPLVLIPGLLTQFAYETQVAAAKASTSLLAEFGRISNALLSVRKVLLEGGLNEAMKDMARYMSDFLNAFAKSDAIKAVAEHLEQLAHSFVTFVTIDPDTAIGILEKIGTAVVAFAGTLKLSIQYLIKSVELMIAEMNRMATSVRSNPKEWFSKRDAVMTLETELENLGKELAVSLEVSYDLVFVGDKKNKVDSLVKQISNDFNNARNTHYNSGRELTKRLNERAVGMDAYRAAGGELTGAGAVGQVGETNADIARGYDEYKEMEDKIRTLTARRHKYLDKGETNNAEATWLRIKATYADQSALFKGINRLEKSQKDAGLQFKEHGGSIEDLDPNNKGGSGGSAGAKRLDVYEKMKAAQEGAISRTMSEIDVIGLHGQALIEHNAAMERKNELDKINAVLAKGDITASQAQNLRDLTAEQELYNVRLGSSQTARYNEMKTSQENAISRTLAETAALGLYGDALIENNAALERKDELDKVEKELIKTNITGEQAQALRELTIAQEEATVAQMKGLVAQEKMNAASQEWRDMWAGSASEFTDMLITMETSFSRFAESLIQQMLKLYMTQKLIEPILGTFFPGTGTSALGSGNNPVKTTPSTGGVALIRPAANGDVFSGGIRPFANGGVVGSPTLFRFASGAGVMGEAGPEGILPLKRGSDGKLGVISHGGGTVNNVNIQTPPGYTAEVEEAQNDTGGIDTAVLIRQIESGLADRVGRRQGPLFHSMQRGGVQGEAR